MPFEMFERLVKQLSAPRKLLLNYSGESTVYPDLARAIGVARESGALVELVSALVNVSNAGLAELCASGLSRLTVSVHSADARRFAEIYRYGSLERMRTRLSRLMELRGAGLTVDFAFVAMDANVAEMADVAAMAQGLGVRSLSVFPVIRRDEIPVEFGRELREGVHRPEFMARVRAAVAKAASEAPEVAVTVCNPAFGDGAAEIGEVPLAFAGPLPEGARIHSCEQNPWETAHVLANGDVVACEVLDRTPLGNLQRQTLAEIWHGAAYTEFRERYRRGEVGECRACPWKRVYREAPLSSDVIAARGGSAQLLHGWHEPDGDHVWSSQEAAAVLRGPAGAGVLHVSGMLPPGVAGEANELAVFCNGAEVGRVENPWAEAIPFGADFRVGGGRDVWEVEFRSRFVFRPCARGMGEDGRDLGFALVLMAAKEAVDQAEAAERRARLGRVERVVRAAEWARRIGPPRRYRRDAAAGAGISIVIPERDNRQELAACLDGVERALEEWREPAEVIVVVNGGEAAEYTELRGLHPRVRWEMQREPLGFSAAVRRGLRRARFDWVYLLNSDVVLEGDALAAAARHRAADVFSIASQIVLKDATRFREETNWTTLVMEDGLVSAHDRIPESGETVEGFYAGGGASLFQRPLLARLARVRAYDPFYWEDVEWGWRARALGYRSLFCAASLAHHTQRATVNRHYAAGEVARIVQRNRILFQLRNMDSGDVARALDEAARCAWVAGKIGGWRGVLAVFGGRFGRPGMSIGTQMNADGRR